MHYYGQPSSAIKEKINQEHVKQILKNWYWLKTVKKMPINLTPIINQHALVHLQEQLTYDLAQLSPLRDTIQHRTGLKVLARQSTC